MGLEQYGAMTAALALMSICDGSLTLGSSDYTTRELSRDHSNADRFFSNFLISRIVFSLVAVGLGLIIRMFVGPDSGIGIVIFAGTYVFSRNVLEYCRALYRAREVFKYEAYSTILEKILVIGFGTYALLNVPTASSALLGMSTGMFIAFVLNLGWVLRRIARFDLNLISFSFFRKVMPEAIPLGLSSIFVLLYYRTDSIMIQAFEGDLVTGQYGIAFRITEAMILLPYIVTSVLLPRLSALHESDVPQFNMVFRKGVLSMGAAALVASTTVFILAPVVIPLLDSSVQALPAITLLRILVIAFALSAVNQMMITHLTATNRQNSLAGILAFAAFFNIGSNLFLIPFWSAPGAAVATVATQVIIGLLFWSTLSKEKMRAKMSVRLTNGSRTG